MPGRFIAIGDVHGCADELEDLLQRLSPGADDRLLFLGDLVNRGPDSHRAIRLVRESGHSSLMGNHELRLLTYRRLGDPSLLKDYDHETIRRLDDADWDFLAGFRAFEETDDGRFVCVHGGFLPGQPWRTQSLATVCRVKWLAPAELPPEDRRGDGPVHWSELWDGPATVVYGHTPDPEIRFAPHAVCIDTACVYGGSLTACVLPEMDFVQVKARRAYA